MVQLTVLMAVRNGGPFLRTAIDSILQQTYNDFIFLIVDDASTDDTRDIVRSYHDPRIQLICLDQNVGQTAALSIGLRKTTTPWIARMDADDYSAPTRLEEQMKALEADPSLRCVGTFAWTFRDDPAVVDGVITTPIKDVDIKGTLVGSPIIHGSLLVSRDAMLDAGGYNDHYRYTNDIDLYDRLLPKNPAANIPKQLLGVRRHSNQGSRTKVALDENLEITANRLLRGTYSRKETVVLRSNLSLCHLTRARYFGREGEYLEFSKDFSRAFRASPRSFFVHFLRLFIIQLLPERSRARLRRLLLGETLLARMLRGHRRSGTLKG